MYFGILVVGLLWDDLRKKLSDFNIGNVWFKEWFGLILGGSKFFCENRLVSVLTSCYESPIRFFINFFFLLVRIDQVIKIFKFYTFTQFSNRVILAYIITIGFQIQFAQPNSHIFHKLKFNLIINQFCLLIIIIFWT